MNNFNQIVLLLQQNRYGEFLIIADAMRSFWNLLILYGLLFSSLGIHSSCVRDELEESIPHGVKSLNNKADFMALLQDGSVMFFKVTGKTTCEVVSNPNGIMGNVTIPSLVSFEGEHFDVTEISAGAFSGCVGLRSISMPSSIHTIGERAFAGCEQLTQVVVPEDIREVKYRTFYNCRSLTKISLPSTVTMIDGEAFAGCQKLAQFDIPDSLVILGERAFAGCASLQDVYLPITVKEIGSEAFAGCYSLLSMPIPFGVKHIEPWLMKDCKNLRELRLSDSVIYIADYAFKGCKNMKSVVLSSSCLTIGRWAFQGCDSLGTIVARSAKPPRLLKESFSCYQTAVVLVPVGALNAYREAPHWKNFQHIRELKMAN